MSEDHVQDVPVLVNPAVGAAFLHHEIIRFQWETGPALIAPVKFRLYIGRTRLAGALRHLSVGCL